MKYCRDELWFQRCWIFDQRCV